MTTPNDQSKPDTSSTPAPGVDSTPVYLGDAELTDAMAKMGGTGVTWNTPVAGEPGAGMSLGPDADGAGKPRIVMVDVPHGTSLAAAIGGTPIDFTTLESVALNPFEISPAGAGGARREGDPLAGLFDPSHAPALAERIKALMPGADVQPAAEDSVSAPTESTTPFVEPEPGAGSPGSTVFNGLPSPIVCVEINLLTGQAVRVTPQESVEELRSFAAAVRAKAPPHHLVLEHPPAADPLTQELADQQTEFARSRTHLPKVDKNEPPAFI
jgi:hypothetical protein